MGRPRQFDEERALDAAMHLFWSQGYEATSTQDLCEVTGLGRSSIYNTFRSKHDLFTLALEQYTRVTGERLLELVGGDEPGRDRIRALFDDCVATAIEEGRDGCFGVNSSIELGPRDEAVDELLRRNTEERVRIVKAVIEEGQRDGSINAERDALSASRFVFANIGAIRMAARGGHGRPMLESIADMAMCAL